MGQPKKPGYKTTEFWLSLCALILGALIASGYIGDESGTSKVIAFAASALTALGYNISRGIVKKAESLGDLIRPEEADPK
jgi:hypothetical protein